MIFLKIFYLWRIKNRSKKRSVILDPFRVFYVRNISWNAIVSYFALYTSQYNRRCHEIREYYTLYFSAGSTDSSRSHRSGIFHYQSNTHLFARVAYLHTHYRANLRHASGPSIDISFCFVSTFMLLNKSFF